MNDGEIISIIKSEIRKHMTMFFSGLVDSNTNMAESVTQLYGQQDTNVNIPNVRTFGIASRAPEGTIAAVAKTGMDPRSKIIIGHVDQKPPAMNAGETVLYDAYGHEIRIEQKAMKFGSANSNSPMVLGDVLQEYETEVLNAVLQAAQIGVCAVGPVFLDPGIRTKLTAAKLKFIDTASTNILSQLSFTERGSSS